MSIGGASLIEKAPHERFLRRSVKVQYTFERGGDFHPTYPFFRKGPRGREKVRIFIKDQGGRGGKNSEVAAKKGSGRKDAKKGGALGKDTSCLDRRDNLAIKKGSREGGVKREVLQSTRRKETRPGKAPIPKKIEEGKVKS